MSSTQPSDPKDAWVRDHTQAGMVVIVDVLQREEKPVDYLKGLSSDKFLIVVPNEFSWNPTLKPFTNPGHKQKYDAETLAEDLEAAGLVYTMKDISFDGWSFLACEATKA